MLKKHNFKYAPEIRLTVYDKRNIVLNAIREEGWEEIGQNLYYRSWTKQSRGKLGRYRKQLYMVEVFVGKQDD